ncbi:DUF1669 domain-containing protein [bacterium]|nr:MAG: DUF1669 domain-containing protein [bacterium]QQR63289.1 MAG: DUF1669 domain-containing protein [bacterium]
MKHFKAAVYAQWLFLVTVLVCLIGYFYVNDFQSLLAAIPQKKISKHVVIHPDGTVKTVMPSEKKRSSSKKVKTVSVKDDSSQSTSSNETKVDLIEKLRAKKGYVTLFAPDDDIYALLLKLINDEKESLKVAIFTFTDPVVVKALQEAATRGVKVEMIVDRGCISDRYSKVDEVHAAGGKVFVYNPAYHNKGKQGIMHHKFIVFSNNFTGTGLVWTGSYNFTKAARYYNQENIVVLNRKGAVRKYARRFEHVKTLCDHYQPLVKVDEASRK